MVDVVYRGNIDEILSVINHLKKYILIFVFVLLVLLSILHFSKYSVQILPLVTVTIVLFSAIYYTTVLILKFITGIASNETVSTNIIRGYIVKLWKNTNCYRFFQACRTNYKRFSHVISFQVIGLVFGRRKRKTSSVVPCDITYGIFLICCVNYVRID